MCLRVRALYVFVCCVCDVLCDVCQCVCVLCLSDCVLCGGFLLLCCVCACVCFATNVLMRVLVRLVYNLSCDGV